ncbi:glycoside hydrolase family 26 protein [Pelobium manganitolerans]|uniref:glycoside hydrolase family 26 protein n=1 Tax=Pelobium manganitolerans TaxID=1842495 RepID=UPI003FA3A8AF
MMLNKWAKCLLLTLGFCTVQTLANATRLVDKQATKETKRLYKNLKKLSKSGIMFGHQDDLAYGVNWKYIAGKSDVHDITGDYAAVHGWDLGGIEHAREKNLDGVPFDKIKQFIIESYQRGAVNTISWHSDNPVTLGNSWDTTNAVSAILPGGDKHQVYLLWLDRLAAFLNSLKAPSGEAVPILFRPFHELNGAWFWWGKAHCSATDYVALWKFTANYLQSKNVHNLIYVFNTNSFASAEEFLERYPGDKHADMISFDSYQFAPLNATNQEIKQSSIAFNNSLKTQLSILDAIAKKHKKPMALAETGFEAVPDANWWTQTLWDAIKDFKICYVLLWRNFGWKANEQKMHYYAPYEGQSSAADFKEFYELERTLFEKDIVHKNLYR